MQEKSENCCHFVMSAMLASCTPLTPALPPLRQECLGQLPEALLEWSCLLFPDTASLLNSQTVI